MSVRARVRCVSCHRVERWVGDDVEVEIPGGSRRPAFAAPRVAFDALALTLRGEQGPIVGRCPSCEAPLVRLEGDAPSIPWAVPLPDGDLQVADGVVTCQGRPVDLDDAERRVVAAYPAWDQWSRRDVLANGMLAAYLPLIAVPVVVWTMAVGVVIVFYSHWASGGGSVGMP